MKKIAIVSMLLMFSSSAFSNSFEFMDLDGIIKKNSEFYNSKEHPYPKNHKFKAQKSNFKEYQQVLRVINPHRYKTRAFDILENAEGDFPADHKKLFLDTNIRYSSQTLSNKGTTNLFALDE